DDENNILYHMLKYDMELRLQAISDTTFPRMQENNDLWNKYISEDPEYLEQERDQWPPEGTTSTGGWVETAWHQLSPYNDFCPLEPGTDDRCVVGCVATAMAQIINYHRYIGNASFNYHDDHYVTTTHNIDIDGDNSILNFPSFGSLNGYLTTLRNDYLQGDTLTHLITHDDIAALNFAVGISVRMNYASQSSGGSGAGPLKVVSALLDKFDYTSAGYMDADDSLFYDILSQNMIDALPAELGISFWIGGDHAVVCDGYNTDDFYHLNFGRGFYSPDTLTQAWYTLPNGYPGAGSAIGAIVNIETIYGTIEGEVALEEGSLAKITDVKVTADSVTVHPVATTHYIGDYTIQLPPGTYDVNASLYGYEPVTIENVQVYIDSITDSIDFVLEIHIPDTVIVDINGTGDYITIQEGIDNVINSDVVLVLPGIYQEHINYNGKLITVASLILITQDSSYIDSTIIDGDYTGSVVKFENEEDNRAILCGFTITNGSAEKGGGIKCSYSSPTLENLIITENMADYGAGVYIYDYSNPSLFNIAINKNTANYGAGIYCNYYSNLSLSNVAISGNNAISGAGIYCKNNSTLDFDSTDRCNIFLNFANIGNDLYAGYNCPTIDVIVDTFTVLEPDDYFAYPIENFTFDILNAKVEQVNVDLYVSPIGSNDNSGLVPDDPLLTISYALVKIIPNSSDPHTIHLSNGTYSPSQTEEIFPLYWRSYISLQGQDANFTILDGEDLSGILYCHNDNDFSIENMTIQNGNAASGAGIYLSSSSPNLTNLFITENTADYGAGVYFSSSSPSLTNLTISENNANDNGGAISYCPGETPPYLLNLANCILWNNTPQEIFDPFNFITATYSDIQDGTGEPWFGEGCIDEDPLFVEEGNHLYHLLEGSPCIDAGNPDMQDPDGTRIDMGCYPTVYDVKKIKDKWNWVSFPRLPRDGNEPVAAPDVLENIEPFPTELELKGFGNVNMGYYEGDWYYNGLYDIQSTFGYKLHTSNTDNSYLPLYGSRVAPDTPITLIASVYSYQLNWIGYWLPQTQMSDVAFGDEWNNVWSIKAEDYYYHDGSMEYKNGTSPTYPWVPIPMEYGKGYLVRVHNTITDFQWYYSGDKISVPEKLKPLSFTYTDKPDYEAINIVEIDEGIIEIGVFQNDICVGAAVVDSSGAQILAYTDYANKDFGELTFQIVSGRGDKQKVNSYSVYDFTTGEYVERKLTAGRQEYSIVRLNTGGGVTFPTEVSLSQNCPNPFGSNTTISYALPEESVVEITIYNIRGQRVKTLVNGKLSAGNHSITWNGEDDNRKRLGNGIYLYKLSTGKKEIIKKMLLMMR
ncbi:MAG: C10 family peptidase, partial [Candidatus Cloacimonetes bacterium]|nr:C10 family peptidase [Candidatus Cloacimonadota bacterium]